MNLQQALDIIRKTVSEAGSEILKLYKKQINIITKEDLSPVTEADIRANMIITNTIRSYYPEHAILSEELEDDLSRLSNKYVWIIDPIDGTKQFISGDDDFTINVALAVDGVPVLGVVSAPALNIEYYAVKGFGAYKNEQKIICPEKKIERVTISKGHARKQEIMFCQELKAQIIRRGSSIKGCLVADGSADCFVRYGKQREWDVCAMNCIINESGATMVLSDGSVRRYNQENTLVTNYVVCHPSNLQKTLKRFNKFVTIK